MPDWYAFSDKQQPKKSTKEEEELLFASRRSSFLCRNGCVASSQPLASSIGLDFLRKGANAADAAIALGAALCVLEPCSTGMGGDMFCLYYDSNQRDLSCINGSGRSPNKLTLDLVQRDLPVPGGKNVNVEKFATSAHAITVPGAARGYEDLYKKHGSKKFTFLELLTPAIELAENGFPISPLTSRSWRAGMPLIQKWLASSNDDSSAGTNAPVPLSGSDGTNGPLPGEIFVNKDMARVLRELGEKGATDGFYNGTTGRAIVDAIQSNGGVMEMEDLLSHETLFPEPICAQYRHVKLWQIPPNGQGIAACIALAGLQHLEQTGKLKKDASTVERYHAMIEMMRLGFMDARRFVSSPDEMAKKSDKEDSNPEQQSIHNIKEATTEWLLDPQRINDRVGKVFDPTKATAQGLPECKRCGTVSFQVVDGQGNAISFVNSNFCGFGTGLVPKNCGFTLQNRGFGFVVDVDDTDHPNILAPNKRPYHTIIPGMLTFADTNELYASISNMGGFMQPQGHLQLTVNLLTSSEDPQKVIDMPRFCIADGTYNGRVCMEDGFDEELIQELQKRGHNMIPNVTGYDRAVFGRAQIIRRDRKTGVLWAGSDGRSDGCAMGF